jgi:hypothetical protein
MQSESLPSLTDYVRHVLDHMPGSNPVMATYCDVRNIHHLAWLEDLGFKRVATLPQYGRLELPFHQLERTMNV